MTFARYLLRQVPGWLAIGFILITLREWGDATWSFVAAVTTLWILKDLALYPSMRRLQERPSRMGIEKLIGEQAVTQKTLDPSGYVLAQGELWRAETAAGENPIPPGTLVEIREAQGLTLKVTKKDA